MASDLPRASTPRKEWRWTARAIWTSRTSNSTLRRVVIATGVVSTVADTAGLTGSRDGIGPAVRFNFPHGLASDGAGNLYVADGGNYTMRKVVLATGVVTTVAGGAGLPGNTDGTGTAARFGYLAGAALDGAGNLDVADQGNSTIRKVVLATGSVSTLAGMVGQHSVQPGPLPASLNRPFGLAALPSGDLFLTSPGENVVLAIR